MSADSRDAGPGRSALWRIELFGGLRAVRGEQVVSRFRTQKTAALLAYLALYRSVPHPREELLELLWPEHDPDSARRSLRVSLTSLRHQLEPPGVPAGAVLAADRWSVSLSRAAAETDVELFETALRRAQQASTPAERVAHLAAAVGGYRGRLAPELYYDWALTEQQRLEAGYLRAVRGLTDDLAALGRGAEAIEHLHRAVACDPLSAELHEALIRLLAARGEVRAALGVYADLARRLREELDAAPPARLRTLAEQLTNTAGNVSAAPVHIPAERERPTGPRPSDPPRGTVTFLLAEWPDRCAAPEPALDEVRGRGGYVVREDEGPLLAAFASARQAAGAALAIADLQPAPRVALDTGDALFRKGEYQCAVLGILWEILRCGHPGQILGSERTAALLKPEPPPGTLVEDLGLYRRSEGGPPTRLLTVRRSDAPAGSFPPPAAPPAIPTNLPRPLSRFFGREREIEKVLSLLGAAESETRLVTLTGPGGIGKTRLAVQTARRLLERYGGAVWFIPLADVTQAEQVPDAIAAALGIERKPGLEPLAQVAGAIGEQQALLVLDNLEQLTAAGAPVVAQLLQQLPRLSCLVTSRSLVAIPGERPVLVEPLPTGGTDGSPDPEAVLRCESAQLFLDRAQSARPDFQITRNNAAAVARLLSLLEGLPLAIELAAARAGAMTAAQMLERIERRFELLQTARHDREARHRSLSATIAWSYARLPPALQRFWARLSVFRGWAPEAAEAVAGQGWDPGELPEALARLQQYSLVQSEEAGPELRFRMLETLREFAAEQLAPEERADAARRHAAHFLEFAERLGNDDRSPGWVARATIDHENLRTALRWSVEQVDTATALGISGGLWSFWYQTGLTREGRDWLDAALALPSGAELDRVRERAIRGAGVLAYHTGDLERSRQYHEEQCAIAERMGDSSRRCSGYELLGNVYFRMGNYDRAAEYYERCWEIERLDEHPTRVPISLVNRGMVEAVRGNFEAARTLLQQCLAQAVALEDSLTILSCRLRLGDLDCGEGRFETGARWFQEALELSREIRHEPAEALALTGLGNAAYGAGDLPLAREYYERAADLHLASASEANLRYVALFLARVALGEGDFAGARDHLAQALARHAIASRHPGIGECLVELSRLALHDRAPKRAARLLGAGAAVRRLSVAAMSPVDREALERHTAAVRDALGERAFTTAFAEGEVWEVEEAVEYAGQARSSRISARTAAGRAPRTP
jgi:predicted ATPase/DNA-binding SARP family transcriptional activator